MKKQFLVVFLFVFAVGTADVFPFNAEMPMNRESAMTSVPSDGTYTRTQYFVTVCTESGHSKGTYTIYLHRGKKYISFNNTWVCIQGKSRFAYRGNWYVIK